jgi:hypothetical protein
MIAVSEPRKTTQKFASENRLRTQAPAKIATIDGPVRVPPENISVMRPQPTPKLIRPLRWSGWSLFGSWLSTSLRFTRFTLGLKRD